MLPHALLLCAVIIWGWTFVATKILLAELGPIEILAMRLAIALPVLCILLLARRVPLGFDRGDVPPLVAGGAIMTVHFLLQIAGLVTTTASNSGWIISVTPLALAVLSFVFLRERIGWSGVAGIVVATTGILLLVSRGRITNLDWLQSTGDWLILLSAHTWAAYTVVTRNLVRRRNPLAVTFTILLISAIFVAIVFIWSGDFSRVRSLSAAGIAALLFLAIAALAVGQWFWQVGVAKLGAARAGLYLYLEPLATLTLAVPLLGEPFGAVTVIGGGLILAGVYLGQRGKSV
jgi:drug/metabolite transporter (DMT)-like permease